MVELQEMQEMEQLIQVVVEEEIVDHRMEDQEDQESLLLELQEVLEFQYHQEQIL